MTLNEKISSHRRRMGWSQEELAEKLGVSRQSVSKWESGLASPEIDKIVVLSEIFGVSTDYLLKDDEVTSDAFTENDDITEESPAVRIVDTDTAKEYTEIKKSTARLCALATFLCIISPITLIILAGISSTFNIGITENVAVGIGLAALFLLVAAAVSIYIYIGAKMQKYEYLSKSGTALAAAARDFVTEKKNEFSKTYFLANGIGTALCILSALPLILVAIIGGGENHAAYVIAMVGVLLLVVGCGVISFVYAGVIQGGFNRLLTAGEDEPENKRKEALESIYWTAAVAIYLGYSFISNDWGNSWIIWPVAGILFGIVEAIFTFFEKKQ